jgi:alkanesulfonate monooxygenase SsuD/methylene tetrahydromethanopterin reductase-like flavin-dependent oxidoreductase (luciferase family)
MAADTDPPSAPLRPAPDPGLGLMLTAGPTPGDWTAAGDGFAALDDLGCSAIWLTDHLFWGRPMPEAMTLAAIAADRTRRATIGTGVLQLPLRTVAAVAKEAATIQTIGEGRFILGVGVGEHEREYTLAGAAFRERGRSLDAGIAQLRDLWTGSDGDDWFVQRPAPAPIPIWLGGRSPAAMARTAAVGDGWMPIFVTAEQFAAADARLDDALAAAGRPSASVVRAVTVIAAVTDGPDEARAALDWCGQLWNLPTRPLEQYVVTGSAARIAEAVDDHRSAGAEHVCLLLATDDPVAMYAQVAEADARG